MIKLTDGLKGYCEGRICEIFSEIARKVIGDKSSPSIYLVDDRVYFHPKYPIRNALILGLDEKSEMSSLDALNTTYNQVLELMTANWTSTKFEDYHPFPTSEHVTIEVGHNIEKEALMAQIFTIAIFQNGPPDLSCPF
jgi:hypothetical protein